MGMDGYGMGMGGGWNNWGWDGGWAGALVCCSFAGDFPWIFHGFFWMARLSKLRA